MKILLCVFCFGVVVALRGAPATVLRSVDDTLIAAAKAGDLAQVKEALAAGADLEVRDNEGSSPLLLATHGNHEAIAAWLIAAGADVNARNHLKDTPYLYAGAEGRFEILKLTLKAGADLKSTNRFGGTALIPAAEKGHLENVRELLKTSIDVNHVNDLGWTALIEAVMRKRSRPEYVQIVEALLAAGANPNLADLKGATPQERALRAGNAHLAELITAAGGK